MFHKILIGIISFYLLTPVFISLIPTSNKNVVETVVTIEKEIETVPWDIVPWDIFIPPKPEIKSLIKFDLTEFHFKYIRPNLADHNPNYKPTVERKK
jgi:hypothetical protein